MKTLKIMSIIGLGWYGLSYLCMIAWNNPIDYESAIGWGILGVMYAIALAIVTLVKVKKQ
jgi:hypothetical protein